MARLTAGAQVPWVVWKGALGGGPGAAMPRALPQPGEQGAADWAAGSQGKLMGCKISDEECLFECMCALAKYSKVMTLSLIDNTVIIPRNDPLSKMIQPSLLHLLPFCPQRLLS